MNLQTYPLAAGGLTAGGGASTVFSVVRPESSDKPLGRTLAGSLGGGGDSELVLFTLTEFYSGNGCAEENHNSPRAVKRQVGTLALGVWPNS